MQMFESVVLSTAVIKQQVGEMMTEKEWNAFAETMKGGKLNEAEQKMQWEAWKKEAEEVGSQWPPRDFDGKPGNVMRLWVKTQDLVILQDKKEREKRLELAHAANKKTTDLDVEKNLQQLELDHDHFGGRGVDIKDSMASMMHNSAGTAFSGNVAQIGDVTTLADDDDDDDDAQDASKGKASTDQQNADKDEEEEVAPPQGKKEKLFNWDVEVSKAQRAMKRKQQTEY